MKRVLGLLLVLMALLVTTCCHNANGQTTMKKVGDPTTYMTPEQLAKYNSDITNAELEKKVATYGKWVGVGNEVGIAVKEGLLAVVDVSDQFGKTDVGKFTLIMVAWKVMGKDVIRILLGLIFIFIITIMFFKTYRNTFKPKKIMIEDKGWLKEKKYDIIKPNLSWDGVVFVKILFLALYAAAFGVTYAIMFG